MVYAAYEIYASLSKYEKSAKAYAVLQGKYQEGAIENSPTQDHQDKVHNELKAINEDYVGWLTIPDTKINYPVVMGADNSFYLNHNFYKEHDFVGAIFMDYRNSRDQVDQHMIVYGHYMKDGSMFGALKNYKDESFYQSHPKIHFNFQGQELQWEIFSVYVQDNELLETDFPTPQEYEDYMLNRKEQSLYEIPTTITEEDTVLTLSTCTNDTRTERIIVHAKLVN